MLWRRLTYLRLPQPFWQCQRGSEVKMQDVSCNFPLPVDHVEQKFMTMALRVVQLKSWGRGTRRWRRSGFCSSSSWKTTNKQQPHKKEKASSGETRQAGNWKPLRQSGQSVLAWRTSRMELHHFGECWRATSETFHCVSSAFKEQPLF